MAGVDSIEKVEISMSDSGSVVYDIFFEEIRPNGRVAFYPLNFLHYMIGRISRDLHVKKKSPEFIIGAVGACLVPGFNFDELFKREENYKVFLNSGIQPRDTLSYLTCFHPNGYCLGEAAIKKYGRQGVGSHILERVIEDSTDMGAKAIVTTVTTGRMQRLARKHAFNYIGDSDYCLIL
jgi:hypothetical protein